MYLLLHSMYFEDLFFDNFNNIYFLLFSFIVTTVSSRVPEHAVAVQEPTTVAVSYYYVLAFNTACIVSVRMSILS